eukprot:SAG31_NODE_36834_length_309_cov_8.761905_1_plen_46_part_10
MHEVQRSLRRRAARAARTSSHLRAARDPVDRQSLTKVQSTERVGSL